MVNVDLNNFVSQIRKQYKNIKHIYVYTSGGRAFTSNIRISNFSCFDGVNFAPKCYADWVNLSLFVWSINSKRIFNSVKSRPSNRLYVFKDQVKVFEEKFSHLVDDLNLNVIYRTWNKEFKTPENEIFRRLPIFLG